MKRARAYRLCLPLLLCCFTSAVQSGPVDELDRVGAATLKVFLWTIYDSRLYTRDGSFDGVEPGLALEINYRRNIKARALIEQTREEWQKQGLYSAYNEQWLQQLMRLWPDVRKGDKLTVYVNEDLSSDFFLNDEKIGSLKETEFTRQFLAIWVSEKSSYPKLRDQLVGLSS